MYVSQAVGRLQLSQCPSSAGLVPGSEIYFSAGFRQLFDCFEADAGALLLVDLCFRAGDKTKNVLSTCDNGNLPLEVD